jgi:hypothetical protein
MNDLRTLNGDPRQGVVVLLVLSDWEPVSICVYICVCECLFVCVGARCSGVAAVEQLEAVSMGVYMHARVCVCVCVCTSWRC